jgi:hypothetical protein
MRGIKGWRQKTRLEESIVQRRQRRKNLRRPQRRPRLVAASTIRTALITKAQHINKSIEVHEHQARFVLVAGEEGCGGLRVAVLSASLD